jgi:hypothetical protein
MPGPKTGPERHRPGPGFSGRFGSSAVHPYRTCWRTFMLTFPSGQARRLIAGALLLSAVSLAAAGCGKGQGDITGKVSYQGKPLAFGTVSIMDSRGQVQYAKIQSDGSYRFEKVPPGEATLVVVCQDPKAPQVLSAASGRGEGPKARSRTLFKAGEAAPKPGGTKLSLIPLEYGDFTKSNLKRTVESGTNQFDLDLKGPAAGNNP